jgi:hypothetical protein
MTIQARSKILKCPICSGARVLAGFNDLKTTDPDIAASAFDWDSQTVTRGSDKKKRWRCDKGHVYEAPPMARTGITKSGCPYCAHQKILAGFNDFATTNPEAAKEADGWDPTEFIGGSKITKDWKCSKGHSYRLSIYRRNLAQIGCPICGNRKALAGFNDLTTTHPKLALEADGWDQQDGIPLVRVYGKSDTYTAHTRNATGVVDVRSRPMYKEWAVKLRIRFDMDQFKTVDVINLISRCGLQVGIGAGRPDSKASAGCGFGLFQVVESDRENAIKAKFGIE